MRRRQIPLPRTDGYEPEDAKALLRQVLRDSRAQRSAHERSQAGGAIAEHVLQAVGPASCVAAWVSRGTEPSSLETLDALRSRGTRVLLPVLGPGLNRTWGEYTSRDDLEVRAPGRPPEPSGPVLPVEAVTEAEVVLLPALAVDALGTRLGQGGGWYDRVLTHVAPGTPVFAMIYDEELIADPLLPVAPHDQPVGAVITPHEWFLLAGSGFQNAALAAQAAAVGDVREEQRQGG